MAKRTIQDSEIALIKAMLDRGMKNKDIQFYFNRPERSVNSGRISTIRTGAYSNSGKILAASAGELDSFIERFASQERNESSPIDDHDVRKFFRRERDSLWYLHRGESEECECKQDFDPKKLTPVVRAIAALANNKGGYVFFGVGNNQCRVDGAGPAFSQTDIVDIINKVKAHLAPTPSITAKGIVDFDGKAVGFLRVDRQTRKLLMRYAIQYHEDHSVGYDYVVGCVVRHRLRFSVPSDFRVGEISLFEELEGADDEYRAWLAQELKKIGQEKLLAK
ncbi:ATP-binding protein [Bradyrhizobium elkanii]